MLEINHESILNELKVIQKQLDTVNIYFDNLIIGSVFIFFILMLIYDLFKI